jgi:hypothetical protein
MTPRNYQINVPTIATEKLDNEVMVVHLVKGNYYSLTGTGAAIWDLIASGTSDTAILSRLVENYAGDAQGMKQSLARFIDELRAEELIVVSGGSAMSKPPPEAGIAPVDRQPFAAPQLEKYTDMQELLLIDPIAEDETLSRSNRPARVRECAARSRP